MQSIESTVAHPNERVLGVADGGEGAEVKDDGELGLLQWQGERSKRRVLDGGAQAVRGRGPTRGLQGQHQAGQGTCHLTQDHLISCL